MGRVRAGRTAGTVGTVSSVDNALRLLSAFRDRPSLAVREGAELLGVAPSTAHRLLTTLQAHGFVAQDEVSRRYRAGPALLDVALGALGGLDVRRLARWHLEHLRDEVRETVNLIVLDRQQGVIRFLDSIEGPEAVRVSSRTGTVLPAHCTAGGRMLLASLSESQILQCYPERKLPALTPMSLTDRDQLLDDLSGVRAQGYATSFGESTPGLTAVALAIRDVRGQVLAAIGVSAPASRLEPGRIQQIVAATRLTIAAIEEELGSGTPPEGLPRTSLA